MQIELRPLRTEDEAALSALYTAVDRRFLSDRLPFPYTVQDADEWLKMVHKHDGKDGLYRAIFADGVLVGTISADQKSDVFRVDAEIGFLLTPQQQAKGIMTEAVRQMCTLVFRTWEIIRITALVYEENIASRKVLENNGFCLEGIMRQAVIKADALHNLCVYGKLKSNAT